MAKKSLSPETFNTLFFAVFLVVAILLAWGVTGVVQLVRRQAEEKEMEAETQGDGGSPTVTYRLQEPQSGPFFLCSPAAPWSEDEVDSAGQGLVPLTPLGGGETPYALAERGLRLKGEALLALHALCTDLIAAGYPVTPYVTRAYLTYEEAGAAAGTTCLHTGYGISLSLCPSEGELLSLSAAGSDPRTAGAALWLSTYAPAYGFVTPEGEADVLYCVGVPHALAMRQGGLSLSAYCDALRLYTREAPWSLVWQGSRFLLFYLPADHGAATLTLSSDTAFFSCGDGARGFFVALAE